MCKWPALVKLGFRNEYSVFYPHPSRSSSEVSVTSGLNKKNCQKLEINQFELINFAGPPSCLSSLQLIHFKLLQNIFGVTIATVQRFLSFIWLNMTLKCKSSGAGTSTKTN